MIVTIDGPAGSGKGTVAKILAKKYNLFYLDTGLLYRAVAYRALSINSDINNEQNNVAIVNQLDFSLLKEEDLRKEKIGNLASIVASQSKVRVALLEFQKNVAHNYSQSYNGSILDGRDCGTVICPNADLKIFFDITLAERTKRRVLQLQQEQNKIVSYEQVLADMKQRDERDINRKTAPLKIAKDSLVINDSSLNIEQVVELIEACIVKKLDQK